MGIYAYGGIYSRSSTLLNSVPIYVFIKMQYEWSIDRERTRLLS